MSDALPSPHPDDPPPFEREQLVRAFAAVLRRMRDERGLTQEDLAAESGVGRTFIAKMETGRTQPTISTLFRLAGALRLAPHDLIKSVTEEWEGK